MIIEVIPIQEGVSSAALTAYVQEVPLGIQVKLNRPAIIICPGGGYVGFNEKEMEPIALRFLSAGFQAFVLSYSIGLGIGRFPAPFIDAAKSVMIIRENAKQWGIDPNRICLCGFSTGGHVAATFAATWHEQYLAQALSVDNKWFQPNGLVLGYPLLDIDQFQIKNKERNPKMYALLEAMFGSVYGTFYPSQENMREWGYKNRITSHMVPTFLWTTLEDDLIDLQESIDFIKELKENQISFEYHVFEKGAHGLSLGDQIVANTQGKTDSIGNTNRWMELALNWIMSLPLKKQ